MPKKQIQTDKAPSAIGPYSQAVRAGNWIYTAGQISLDPKTGQLITGDIKANTRQVLENIREILKAAGAEMDDVVKCNIYLTNLADFAQMNEVYGEFFKPPYPARSTVQAAALPKNASIEIDAIAYLGE